MYSTWASSTFDALLLISAGTDLVVLSFQLLLDCETVIFFFFVFFLFFFLPQFLSYFLDVFFASLLSLTHSLPPPPPSPHMLHTKGNGHFVLLQAIRLTIPRSWLTQKVRAALWSETDSYPVAIYVFWGWKKSRLRRARGLMGRDEGKIARAPQPNLHSSLTPKTHR